MISNSEIIAFNHYTNKLYLFVCINNIMKIYIGAEVEFVEFYDLQTRVNEPKKAETRENIFIDCYSKLFILSNILLLR